jgi:hypothetical protein
MDAAVPLRASSRDGERGERWGERRDSARGKGRVDRGGEANPRRRSGSLPRTGPESGRVEPAVVPRQTPESRPHPAGKELVAPALTQRRAAAFDSLY